MTNYAMSSAMSSAQLEQQFQARIAQAKEAARLASIAAAARESNASNGLPLTSAANSPGVPFCPMSTALQSSTRFAKSFPMGNVPPGVKNRIDRLVDFVARNGDVFEATARERERDNPDFAFLKPDGPFSDYYQWKKQQMCGSSPLVAQSAPSLSPRALSDSSNAAAPTQLVTTDPLGGLSVGAIANVCKYARASGVQTYAPIPREVIMNVGNLPPVEPARLEIRLLEFYRHEKRSSQ